MVDASVVAGGVAVVGSVIVVGMVVVEAIVSVDVINTEQQVAEMVSDSMDETTFSYLLFYSTYDDVE